MMNWVSWWPEGVLIGGLLVAAAGLLRYRYRKTSLDGLGALPTAQGKPGPQGALDTVLDWAPTSTRLLTHTERDAYQTLCKALPDYMILAQVPIARFLKVPTRNSYAEWLRRVGYLCVDLAVCDSSSHVLAVVEVRPDPTQETERQRRRQQRAEKVLRAAHVPVHIWRAGELPNVQAVRESILGSDPDLLACPIVDIPVVAGLSRDAESVYSEATGVDFNLDELSNDSGEMAPRGMTAHRDPPPSTWFDDLGSTMPAPLDGVQSRR